MPVRQLPTRAVEKVWGRHDLPATFGKLDSSSDPIGEIWFEDQPDSPLLIKYIFTSQKLSIQVHPSDEQARAIGYARGKDEAWYVLSAEPDAVIGAGFARQLSAADLRAATLDGSVDDLLTWHRVQPGDFFYVPAGTVHAIGAGVSLLEIQQNVDLTYRLFDYGRPRELQIEEGLAAARPVPFEHRAPQTVDAWRDVLVEGPKIVIERLRGPSERTISAASDDPVWLMPMSDGCTADGAQIRAGTVWLAEASVRIGLGPDDYLLAAYPGSTARP